MHATLATWAIYGVLAKGLSELHCCHLRHKNDAIKVICSKLTESGGVVSDEVIGTVLTLASFEVRSLFSRKSPWLLTRARIYSGLMIKPSYIW